MPSSARAWVSASSRACRSGKLRRCSSQVHRAWNAITSSIEPRLTGIVVSSGLGGTAVDDVVVDEAVVVAGSGASSVNGIADVGSEDPPHPARISAKRKPRTASRGRDSCITPVRIGWSRRKFTGFVAKVGQTIQAVRPSTNLAILRCTRSEVRRIGPIGQRGPTGQVKRRLASNK